MVNCSKEMIVLKGKIKTPFVQTCLYNRDTHKWDVTFSNGQTFSYAYYNVEKLHDPIRLDLNIYSLRQGGQYLGAIKDIYRFSGRSTYFHVEFENGYAKDYRDDEVSLVKTAFQSKKSNDLWEYFSCISEISNLRNDNGELLLKMQFDKIGFVAETSALCPYLNAERPNKRVGQFPIFPFGCNNSQYKAVENAINNQLSVIQGPPGTGKTQTILNIIANLLVAGKTVQIVSNNNSAIENVQEKLASAKYDLGFIVAKLGKADNKRQFVQDQITQYPDFRKWVYNGSLGELKAEIQSLTQKMKLIYSDEEQIAKLSSEKNSIAVEKAHFDQYLKETGTVLCNIKLKKKVRSSDIMHLWQMILERAENGASLSLWQRILLFLKHGLRDSSLFDQDPAQTVSSLQALYFEKRMEETDKEIGRLKAEIKGIRVDTEELTSKSLQYLKHILAERYNRNDARTVFSEDDFWKNPQDVLAEYPVTLSTTFSSRSSLGSRMKVVQYDYLIMDEASQVDVATGVLALSSSDNAVIVGDTKQLPNVITDEDRERAESIYKRFDLPKGYGFTKSFLQSVLDIVPDIPMTLLREHYRCHPKIINFCNQKFYDGKLIVMTHDNGEDNVIKAITTVAGKHERDRFNKRQIDAIKQEILPELGGSYSDVGIISPYRNQVEAISKEIPDVEVNTVHKFQGREKDTIIISTVDDEKNDFSDDPYLINVAVSRAKKHLYIVASGNETEDGNINDLISYIRYNNCEVVESKVYSIFDYLYSSYSDARMQYLKDKKRISEYDSENLMMALIDDILEENKRKDIGVVCHFPLNMLLRNRENLTEEERIYAVNPLTHLDFTLFSRISKRVLAAIEVDGYSFHKEGTRQAERDLLKNSILAKYGIPLLRFSTNGSGEIARLQKVIEGLRDKEYEDTPGENYGSFDEFVSQRGAAYGYGQKGRTAPAKPVSTARPVNQPKSSAPSAGFGFGAKPNAQTGVPAGASAGGKRLVGSAYKKDQRVMHDKFGRGVILDIQGAGDTATLTVDFETFGVKRLAAGYVTMRLIEE